MKPRVKTKLFFFYNGNSILLPRQVHNIANVILLYIHMYNVNAAFVQHSVVIQFYFCRMPSAKPTFIVQVNNFQYPEVDP